MFGPSRLAVVMIRTLGRLPAVAPVLRWVKPYVQSQVVRNASTLVSYTMVGYGASVLGSPIVTRLYTPTEFGLYGTFLVFPSACGVLVALYYDFAIPAPQDDLEAANLAAGAVATSFVTSALSSLVYLMCVSNNWLGYASLPKDSAWLCLFFILICGLLSISQYWCLRRSNFHAIGVGSLVTNVGRALVQIASAVGGWAGLVFGEVLGRVFTIAQYTFTNRHDIHKFAPKVSVRAAAQAMWRHRRFAMVLLPSAFIDQILSMIAVPVMVPIFGISAAGQYFLMKRVLDMPMALVSRTISDSFYNRITEHAHNSPERVRPLLVRTFCLISGVAIVGMLPLMIFGPSLFAFVFGKAWREAGMLAAVMVPGVAVSLGVSPVSRVFAITRSPGLRYVFTVLTTLCLTATLTMAWMGWLNLVETAAGLSLTYCISYSAYFVTAYIAAGRISTE